MTEEQFRQQLSDNGYGPAQIKEFAPHTDGPLHTHDFSVMLMVLEGEFTLAREDGATSYGPGECCQLAAGGMHAERTGAEGAKVMLGKK